MKLVGVNMKPENNIAYQLGFYVGEQLVHQYLPTLSVDDIQTRNNISVTCGEGDHYRKLEDIWGKQYDIDKKSADKEWKEYKAYSKLLEDKYLPKTLECFFENLELTENDISSFKEGLILSLWDCDCCSYSLSPDDIKIEHVKNGSKIFLIKD